MVIFDMQQENGIADFPAANIMCFEKEFNILLYGITIPMVFLNIGHTLIIFYPQLGNM